MLGIEKLKSIIATVLGFGLALQSKISDDGQLSWAEIASLLPNLIQLPSAISSVPAAYREFRDLDDSERSDLYAYFCNLFDLQNDKIEHAIEAGFKFLLCGDEFVKSVTHSKS